MNKAWTGTPSNPDVLADVQKMIETLRHDKRYRPYEMHLPDDYLIREGKDPNDYPELEGHPGWRVVRAK